MQRYPVPDDIEKKSVAVFRAGDRRDDRAAQIALNAFLSYIEDGKMSSVKARATLADSKKISDFIQKIRDDIKQSKIAKRNEYEIESAKLLAAAVANSEKTLNGQSEMRGEFKELLNQMQSHVGDLKNTAEASHLVVSKINAATESMSKDVVKAVENTSTRTAAILGFVVGFCSIRCRDRLIAALSTPYKSPRKSCVIAHRYRIKSTSRWSSNPPTPYGRPALFLGTTTHFC